MVVVVGLSNGQNSRYVFSHLMICFIDFHKMYDSGCRLKGEHLENLIFLSLFFNGFVFVGLCEDGEL
jgi:hypothetical protein